MTIAIKHSTLSGGTIAENPSQGLIGPTAWDEEHTINLTGPGIIGRTTSGSGPAGLLTPEQTRNYLGVVAAVTPYQYGAVGNGVADDTAALQAALDYCATSGYALYLGVGRFKVTSPLNVTSGMRIHGEGWDDSWIIGGNFNLFNVTGNNGFMLEKMLILGPTDGSVSTATSGYAITIDGSVVNNASTIRDVRIVFYHDYVSFGKAQAWTIDNCQFMGCPSTGTGILLQNTYAPGNGENNIINTLIQGGNGAVTWGTTGISYTSSVNLKIVNSEIYGWTTGFNMSMLSGASLASVEIANSIFSQLETAFSLNKGSGTAFNMFILYGNQIMARHGVVADSNTGWLYDLLIFGNNFGVGEGDPVSSATGTGINLPAANTFLIYGNTFYGEAGNTAINIGSNSSNGQIHMNQLRGAITAPVVSSGTTFMSTYYGDVASWTGAASYEFDGPIKTGTAGLLLRDTGGDHHRQLVIAENLTANRVAYIVMGDYDTTLDFNAGVSDVRANTAYKIASIEKWWNAKAPVTVTYAASVALNFSTLENGQITLTGNLTLANPTNAKPGSSGVIRLIQDATGSRTVSFGTNWKFAGGTVPTASTAANAIDSLHYYVHSSTNIEATLAKDVK